MRKFGLFFFSILLFIGCASVDITKTAKGFYPPTDPNEVDILLTGSDRPFIELGSVTVEGFGTKETAKMHNAIRAKAAELGANAVILKNEGITRGSGFSGPKRWATGAAIRYKDTIK